MRYFPAFLLLALSNAAIAEEKTLEVGKHVAGNMDAASMIISLIMVLFLIIISALVLKKFQPHAANSQHLKIVTSMHLGAKEKLVVVQVGEKQLLLGVTQQQVNLIETLDEKIPVTKPLAAEINGSMVDFLKRYKKPSSTAGPDSQPKE